MCHCESQLGDLLRLRWPAPDPPFPCQVDYLSLGLRMYSLAHPPTRRNTWGCATLSKFPFQSQMWEVLPSDHGEAACFQVRGGAGRAPGANVPVEVLLRAEQQSDASAGL